MPRFVLVIRLARAGGAVVPATGEAAAGKPPHPASPPPRGCPRGCGNCGNAPATAISDSRSVPAPLPPGAPACRTPPRKRRRKGWECPALPPPVRHGGSGSKLRFSARKSSYCRDFHRACFGEGRILSRPPALRPCPAPRRRDRASPAPGRPCQRIPRRVIQRRAEYVHVRVVFDLHDHRVAAGHHQTQKRRLQLRIGDVIGGDMSPDVVNRDQGFPQRQRRRLAKFTPTNTAPIRPGA